ncbi:MAG TPA: thiol:disulfide interchange protein DsbA/DsbL [Lysobacter sp.]|jgi:thiol:disulfide interchange protein DsbA|nr:thiol:disulfide interchange protein DsbA/DsbL [Lysobacter sp.]
MTSRFSLLLALLLPLLLGLLLGLLLVPSAAFAAKPAPAPALVAGTDYETIENGAPFEPVAGKIEVVEVFGYTCPHCAHFEPALEAWKAKLPADVKFTPVAAPFGSYWTPYAKAYFAAKTLGIADRSHEAVFHALHEEGSLPRNPTDDEIANFYAQYGVQPAHFLATFNGAAVEALMQRADAFVRSSGVEGTPTMIVAGKYRVMTAGRTYEDILRIIDQLVARERAATKR